MENSLPLFHLAHGTIVRVVLIGAVAEDVSGKGATVPFEYHFVHRGRLSRYQVNKRMSRWFLNTLRSAIHRQDPQLYRRRFASDRRWEARNLQVKP